MTRKGTVLALLATMFISGPAMAQETLVEYVYMACEAPIVEYCDQVTLGEGRMLYCLAAHEDKISADCEFALYTAATVIQDLTAAIAEELADAVEYLAVECGTDIEEHCTDVPFGEGRILMCLDKAEAEEEDGLTEECITAITNVFGN